VKRSSSSAPDTLAIKKTKISSNDDKKTDQAFNKATPGPIFKKTKPAPKSYNRLAPPRKPAKLRVLHFVSTTARHRVVYTEVPTPSSPPQALQWVTLNQGPTSYNIAAAQTV
jgi:hypothetical protein